MMRKRTESLLLIALCIVLMGVSLVACMGPDLPAESVPELLLEAGDEAVFADDDLSPLPTPSEPDDDDEVDDDTTEVPSESAQAQTLRQVGGSASGLVSSSAGSNAQQTFAAQAAAAAQSQPISSSTPSSSQSSASQVVSSSSTPIVSTPTYSVGYEHDITDQVISILNRRRRENGLDELARNAGLMEAAAIRSTELFTSYTHTRPDGSSCFTAIANRRDFGGVAENICMGYSTAEAIMTAFMNSSGHYKNIMGNYDSLGISVYRGSDGKLYCAQLFGKVTSYGNSSSSGSSSSSSSSSSSGSSSSDGSANSEPEETVIVDAQLSEESLTLRVGESRQVTVNVGSSGIPGLTLDWSSSGTQLTVTSNGIITAHEPGLALAMVKVVVNGQTKQILYCNVEILPVEETVSQPDIDGDSSGSDTGETPTESSMQDDHDADFDDISG